jgi:hypothetical protein
MRRSISLIALIHQRAVVHLMHHLNCSANLFRCLTIAQCLKN